MNEPLCPLCQRAFGEQSQLHHLKPRTFRGRDKNIKDQENLVMIHKICHSAVHAFFKEKELYKYYHTVERLLEDEHMKNFVKWVAKKDPDFYVKMKRSENRR
jgi:hypothetical protein